MTYFIGGGYNGKEVPFDKIHEQVIVDFSGPTKSVYVQRKQYIRTQVSFHGTVKTFYIIEGCKPIEHRDQILALWESVKTDVYAI